MTDIEINAIYYTALRQHIRAQDMSNVYAFARAILAAVEAKQQLKGVIANNAHLTCLNNSSMMGSSVSNSDNNQQGESMANTPTFKDAENEYRKLPYVPHDSLKEDEVSDFVFRAESEISYWEGGEEDEDYDRAGLNKLRRFIDKWKPYKHLKKDAA
jgi:hypothetical protein